MDQIVFAIDYTKNREGKTVYRGAAVGTVEGLASAQITAVFEGDSAPSILLEVFRAFRYLMGVSYSSSAPAIVRLKDKEVTVLLSMLTTAAAAKSVISKLTTM